MSENNPSSNGSQPREPQYCILEEVTSLHGTIKVTQQGCEIKTFISKQVSNYNGAQNNFANYGQASAAGYLLHNDGRFNAIQPGPPGRQVVPSYVVQSYSQNDGRQDDATGIVNDAVHQSDVESIDDQDDVESIEGQNDAVEQSNAKSIDHQEDDEEQFSAESIAKQDDAVSQSDAESDDNQSDATSMDGQDDDVDQSDAESIDSQNDVTNAQGLYFDGSNEGTHHVSLGVKNDPRNYNVQRVADRNSGHNARELQQEIRLPEQLVSTQENQFTATERWKYLYEIRHRENAELRRTLSQTKIKLKNQKAIVGQLVDICSRYDARNDSCNQEISSLTEEADASRDKMNKLLAHNLTITNDANQYKAMLVDLESRHQLLKDLIGDDVRTFYENQLESTRTRHERETTYLNEQINTLTAALEKNKAEHTNFHKSIEELHVELQAMSDNENVLNQQLKANEIEIQELKSGDVQFSKLTAAFIKDFNNLLSILLHDESHESSRVAQLQHTDPAAFEKLIRHVQDTCNNDDLQLKNLATILANAKK